MRSGQDQTTHQSLIAELVDLFLREQFTVSGADGVDGYYPPIEMRNSGYGDQEDKTPDVYAFDPGRGRYIIGEAKTGNGDFETEESLTQYNVFLDQRHPATHAPTLVYFIVPSSRMAEFNTLITHYIHRDLWAHITIVPSKRTQA
jgi:hypothetical protein